MHVLAWMLLFNRLLFSIVFPIFSYGLEKEFRDDLYKDFEELTLDFCLKGNIYGLEKYW